mgnify:CR=1 FL=1
MKTNKRILDLCNVLQFLFLAFFAWVLLDFLHMSKDEREMMAFFSIVMLGLAILGGSLTLALKDYCKSVMQSAADTLFFFIFQYAILILISRETVYMCSFL